MNGIFITGTDTGIGKTITSALIISALQKYEIPSMYFKPVQTGLDDDTETLKSLTETKTLQPVYKFRDPISPNRAAALASEVIDLKKIKSTLGLIQKEFLVIEGAGGLMVPLNQRENTRDLVSLLDLPLIIVASTRLGTINHTLLTIECARARNVRISGVILVGPEDPGLGETLKDVADVQILAEISILKVSRSEIRNQGPLIFRENIISQICGVS
jgi:dethiobiotin synthase